jgi:hypothetical protein
VILHFNHLSRGKSVKSLDELTGLIAGSLTTLAESGAIEQKLLRTLRVHLDWIHYKTNFREPVTVRRTTMPTGEPGPMAEIAIDLRQADPAGLPRQLAHALSQAHASGPDDDGVYLDQFVPWRNSIIWKFNKLFWQWLPGWEAASGRGFEEALPSGASDANHPQAIADSVCEFFRLLKIWTSATSCQPRSRRSRSAVVRACGRRRGWTASGRSMNTPAPATTRG